MIEVQKPVWSKSILGPSLLFGLLILRLPFLTGVAVLIVPTPYWIWPTFEIGTYLLTALLIFTERNRLLDFNIGTEALVLLIVVPIFKPFVDILFDINVPFAEGPVNWVQTSISVVLLLVLVITRTKLPGLRKRVFVWIGIATVVGTIMGFGSAYINGVRGTRFGASVPILIFLFLRQLTAAASLEEPVFRGFLWGYLNKLGWNDGIIYLFQAFLFWLGHIYYFNKAPASLWITVPISGLILGFMVWRSRSIAPSMVAHGFLNSVSDLIATYKL